jgi:outer membrane biosynthesis protein TonB
MQRPLNQLPPGTRFRQPDLDITGTLLMVNECRALVRIDHPQQLVEFTAPDGSIRTFRASRNHDTSWAPTVVVEALSFEPLPERDTTMPTKKTTKKAPAPKAAAKAAKPAAPAKVAAPTQTPKPAKAPKADGKLSQLDAAVKVLTESGTPMTTKAMIEAMATKNYWTSPGGATPHATLYSALIREIGQKGDASRFLKADKGLLGLKQ